jgi:hypothetical protein
MNFYKINLTEIINADKNKAAITKLLLIKL